MRTKLALLICTLVAFSFGGDTMLKIGDNAPEFSLLTQDNQKVGLSDFKGKNYVVLVFYPGDETPVCTKQLCEIRDDYSAFEKRDAVVLGINPGTEKSHKKFADKHQFQFPLLIDNKSVIADLYKAKGLVMNSRTVYVVNKEGKISFAQRGKPPVSEILASIPEQKNDSLKIDSK
jgi:peroxiredoxin Q/BCP